MKKQNSIHIRILRLIIGSILLTVVLIGGTGIINSNRAIKEDSAQIMNLICVEKTNEIEYRLLNVEHAVENVYNYANGHLVQNLSLIQKNFYMEAYLNTVYDVLKNAAESTECAVSVYLRFNPEQIQSAKGIFLARTSEDAEFVEQEMTDITAYESDDIGHVGWYHIPVTAKKPVWMEPYVDQHLHTEVISYVIPIFREDVPIGVIGMDVKLDLLREIADGVTVYETGSALLVAMDGTLLFHKHYPELAEQEETLFEQVKTLVGPDREEGKMYSYRWQGESKQLVFRRMINGMYLAITAPSAEINANRNALMLQYSFALVVTLLLCIPFSTKVAGKIIRPLLELTDAANQIAKGNTMEELNRQIAHVNTLAYHDTLTGLYNRHYMREYCIEYVKGEQKDVGVIFCDLNRLKYVNDHYGHNAGDALITEFTKKLTEWYPDGMCCRMSGDEFVVILLQIPKEIFEKRLLEFREAITQEGLPLASVGGCWKEKAYAESIGEMLNEAEDVMYVEKKKFHEEYPQFTR